MAKKYPSEIIDRVVELRQKNTPQAIVMQVIWEEFEVEISKPSISLITQTYGHVSERKPYRLPNCDKWCFVYDNLELPRGA